LRNVFIFTLSKNANSSFCEISFSSCCTKSTKIEWG
jgi:hypothetical protein